MLDEYQELLGGFSVGDFFPSLEFLHVLTGHKARLDRAFERFAKLFCDVIEERLRLGVGGGCKVDFVDILLELQKDGDGEVPLTMDNVKAILLDTITGATDTVFTSLEWMMAELLRHPTVMEKLQDEVREIVKDKQKITDDDLKKMQYMKAVIKETFRLHPPGALGAPRVASEDVNIKRYDISKGTVVMVNIWAIGRDPASWDEPEKFMPERFLNSSTDYNSMDFRWIPFGAGRRACPGMTYSMPIIELVLANLLQKFDWKLPDGVVLDMTDCAGLATHKAIPLVAIASKNA